MNAPTELLPALVALLETESVTLAARRLGVGQPAMSRTLEKLRASTADALLVRVGRGLVRTQRGTELLPRVRELLATAEALLTAPPPFDPRFSTGVVTLALGDDMQAMLAGRLLARLREEAPGLDVRVRSLTLDVAHHAERGTVDVVVFPDLRGHASMPPSEDMVLRPVYTRRFVTVTRSRRRLALASFARADHVLVSPQGEEGGYVDDSLRALGLGRRVAVTVPTFQAALALVRESELVATLPDDLVRALGAGLNAQSCPVSTPELPMCVAWAARFVAEPRHRWLRERVAGELARLGGAAKRRSPRASAQRSASSRARNSSTA